MPARVGSMTSAVPVARQKGEDSWDQDEGDAQHKASPPLRENGVPSSLTWPLGAQ